MTFSALVTSKLARLLPCLDCSAILAAAQAGQLTAPDALRQLRALCDHAISTSWRAGQRAVAQAASELLDEGNELLAELDEGPAAAGGAVLLTTAREESEEPAVARPQLPAETFFLAPEQVRECLTLNIDSSILMAAQPPRRTGGWPLGRKRKVEGTGSAALGTPECRTKSEVHLTQCCAHPLPAGWLACFSNIEALVLRVHLADSCDASRQYRQAQDGRQAFQPLDARAAAAVGHGAATGTEVGH